MYQDTREKEKTEVDDLRRALEQEKQEKAERKKNEREEALKLIAANEKDLVKRRL